MTQRDGSRSLRAPAIHVPVEKRGPRDRIVHPLTPGLYQLRERFVATKVDKRRTGQGFDTADGFRAGARFWIIADPYVWTREEPDETREHFELIAPFASGIAHAIARGFRERGANAITWVTPIPADIRRLLDLLEPDTSVETWLDHALEVSRHQHGHGDDVLLELLRSGALSREQIIAARDAVKEKHRNQ